MTLKVWSLNQWQQHHMGTCHKCKVSDPIVDLGNQNLGMSLGHLCFHQPSRCCYKSRQAFNVRRKTFLLLASPLRTTCVSKGKPQGTKCLEGKQG